MRTVRISSLALCAFGCAHVVATRPIESNPTTADVEAKARGHFEKLSRREFAAAFADYDDPMKAAVPLEVLQKSWMDTKNAGEPSSASKQREPRPTTMVGRPSWSSILLLTFTPSASTSILPD